MVTIYYNINRYTSGIYNFCPLLSSPTFDCTPYGYKPQKSNTKFAHFGKKLSNALFSWPNPDKPAIFWHWQTKPKAHYIHHSIAIAKILRSLFTLFPHLIVFIKKWPSSALCRGWVQSPSGNGMAMATWN